MKSLHDEVVEYLSAKNIEVNHHNDTLNEWPPIIGAFIGEQAGHTRIYAFAFELKRQGQELSPKQEWMKERLTHEPNAWSYAVITNLDQVVAFLKARGIE